MHESPIGTFRTCRDSLMSAFYPDCVAKLRLRRLANRDFVGLRRHLREQRMLGRQESGQGQFFYSFDLDKVVPPITWYGKSMVCWT